MFFFLEFAHGHSFDEETSEAREGVDDEDVGLKLYRGEGFDIVDGDLFKEPDFVCEDRETRSAFIEAGDDYFILK